MIIWRRRLIAYEDRTTMTQTKRSRPCDENNRNCCYEFPCETGHTCASGVCINRKCGPVCTPPCMHGGICTWPDTCCCPPTYTGSRCEELHDYISDIRIRRIDTHQHILPDFLAKAINETGGDPSGFPTPTWSVQQAKAAISALGIETAILSVSSPGTKIYENNTQKARNLARQLNEFLADLVKNDSKQFGFFACLPPLTDLQGALDEIDHGHFVLKANGFTLYTSYGHGQYLGHPSFQPIWARLNELKTVVFIHPSEAPTTFVNRYLVQPLADYPQETTRTVADLVITGTRAAFPDVNIILPHAGGTLPILADRIARGCGGLSVLTCPRQPDQILADFRSFYYDTALSTGTIQLQALLEFADPSKILFGSDIPYAPARGALLLAQALDSFFLNKSQQYDELWESINHKNAKNLFPNKVQD